MPADPSARKLILASSSPRRRQLLREAGYDFEVEPPSVDERFEEHEAPEQIARRLALEKGREVAGRVGPGACVLAADTLVVLGQEIFGKPADAREAEQMLLRLAGETHRVLTGFAVIRSDDGHTEQGVSVSHVRMREISPEHARAYAESGEPADKAGGYAVQGEAGRFVESIEGLRSNVIGLPLEDVAPLLERCGVVLR